MKKEVMQTAWQLIKDGICNGIASALKMAWVRIKLLAQLKKGIAYFSFKKTDGSTREAIGTLRNGNFSYEAKGSDKKPNLANVTFWDVEKRAFRSLRLDSFVGFN
jgi:hypothetical protein